MSSKRRRHNKLNKRNQRNRKSRHRQQNKKTSKKAFEVGAYICIRKQKEGVGLVKKTGDKNSYLIAFKNGKYGWYRSTKINLITEQEYNTASSQFVIDKNLPSPSPTPSVTYSPSPSPINTSNPIHQQIKFKQFQPTQANDMDNTANTENFAEQTQESKIEIKIQQINDENKSELKSMQNIGDDAKQQHIQNDDAKSKTDQVTVSLDKSVLNNDDKNTKLNEEKKRNDEKKTQKKENIVTYSPSSSPINHQINDTQTVENKPQQIEFKELQSTQTNDIDIDDTNNTQNIEIKIQSALETLTDSDIKQMPNIDDDAKQQCIQKDKGQTHEVIASLDNTQITDSEIKPVQNIGDIKHEMKEILNDDKITKQEKKSKDEKKKKKKKERIITPKISKFEKKMKLYYKVKDLRERSFLIMCDENRMIDLKSLYEYIAHFGHSKASKNKVNDFLVFMKPNTNNLVSFSKFVKAIDEDGDVIAAFQRFQKCGNARSKK